MNKKFIYGVVLASAIVGNANAGSIFDALSETYTTNPTLQAQRAYLRSVDENVAIAKSGFRPNIALIAGYTDASVSGNSSLADKDNSQKTMGARLVQPLFSGMQTVNTVKSQDKFVRSEQNNLFNVEQSILLDASTSYLDVLKDKVIVNLQRNNEQLLTKRLYETEQRFEVGEVTRTDVSQAKARFSRAEADRIASEGVFEASVAQYEQIIGSKPDALVEPVDITKILPLSMGDAVSYAMTNNYTIRQANDLLESKEFNTKAQNGALLPQIDASAAAIRNEGEIDLYSGDTTIDNIEWGINMTIPLYNSGETRAKIRQSKYQKWQAQETVLEARRYVMANVTSAWEIMKSNKAKIKSIKDQVSANEIALDGVQKEEALGNRTILDVLDAYQELLNSNVEEIKAKRDYYVSGMNLLLSMGKLTAEDLNLNVELYNAKEFYKDTKNKWLSLSVD